MHAFGVAHTFLLVNAPGHRMRAQRLHAFFFGLYERLRQQAFGVARCNLTPANTDARRYQPAFYLGPCNP